MKTLLTVLSLALFISSCLAMTGKKTGLVLYIKSSTSSPPSTVSTNRDVVFGGIVGYSVNAQFLKCSFNKFNLTYPTAVTGKGVYQLNLSVSLATKTRSEAKALVDAQFLANTGKTITSVADFIMYHFPSEMKAYYDSLDGNVLATAIGVQNTFYHPDYLTAAGVHVHELGHNIGLNHAGKGLDPYGDTTSQMGSSTNLQICFNAANNARLGWYSNKHRIISVTSTSTSWTATLIGVVDYEKTGGQVIVEFTRTGAASVFLGFNRAKGFNKETGEADTLSVILSTEEGRGSKILANLGVGGVHTVLQFLTGKNLKITAGTRSIVNSATTADTMEVSVRLENSGGATVPL